LSGSKEFKTNPPSDGLVGLQRHHSGVHPIPDAAERIGKIELIFDSRKGLIGRSIDLQSSNLGRKSFDMDAIVCSRICQVDHYSSVGAAEVGKVVIHIDIAKRSPCGRPEIVFGVGHWK